MSGKKRDSVVSRRDFFRRGALAGAGAGLAAQAPAQTGAGRIRFDRVADVVVVGAGASGLPAAIMARDQGATVIVIDSNHDIGGHAMVSGGRVPLGGGTSLQKKYGITDSADQVYLDHTNHRNREFRFGDRDLIRMWADENAATFEFLHRKRCPLQRRSPDHCEWRNGSPALCRQAVLRQPERNHQREPGLRAGATPRGQREVQGRDISSAA